MKPGMMTTAMICFALTGCAGLENFLRLSSYERTLANSDRSDTTVTEVTSNRDSRGRRAALLSAFYGLDDGLAVGADMAICEGAEGTDGLPVIFSHEIDMSTMQVGDFRITTQSGQTGQITCVTLAPADDPGELRTVLLAGALGSIDDQPAKVEIIGNLLSIDNSVNFKGTSVQVTPLEGGPTLVFAEIVPEQEWEIGKKATPLVWGGGSGCPAGTQQVVRAVWAGGITKPGGAEVDDTERRQYRVTVMRGDSRTEITPFALADLGDNDNNHQLCLDVPGKPMAVRFAKGYVTDPRDDLNPETSIGIEE